MGGLCGITSCAEKDFFDVKRSAVLLAKEGKTLVQHSGDNLKRSADTNKPGLLRFQLAQSHRFFFSSSQKTEQEKKSLEIVTVGKGDKTCWCNSSYSAEKRVCFLGLLNQADCPSVINVCHSISQTVPPGPCKRKDMSHHATLPGRLRYSGSVFAGDVARVDIR